MATVVGTSGAWKEVMQRLVELGLPVAHPRDIGTELDKLRDSYDERVAQFFVQVGNEIAALESQLAQMRVDTESRIQAKSATLTQQIAQTDLRISQLQAEHGFFRRLLNRGRVKLAQHQRRSIQAEFNKFCVSLNNAIATVRNRAEDMKKSKSHIVEQRKSSLDLTIARLENILTSKELAGAQAEVEVVEILAKATRGASQFGWRRRTPISSLPPARMKRTSPTLPNAASTFPRKR